MSDECLRPATCRYARRVRRARADARRRRREFTSEEKISPGKSKELSFFITTPPAQRISIYALDKKERDGLDGHVVVVRVLYDDGTVWERQK